MSIKVTFTKNLQSLVAAPPRELDGGASPTVRSVLDRLFAENRPLRGFVLDEQGGLRRHMVVFINGKQVEDRAGLADSLQDGDELYVMQALSGG